MALNENLLAYWNLNNNGSGGVSLVDSTGNGNTLSNPNDVNLGSGIIGGDAVIVATLGFTNATHDFLSGLPAVSFSGWLKLSNGGGNAILWGDSVSSIGFGAGGVPTLNTTINGVSISDGDVSLTVGDWANLVVVYDSINGVSQIYLNGDPIKTAETNGTYGAGGTSYLGSLNEYVDFSFRYQVDEVGVWGRALSQSEVTALYNNSYGRTFPFPQIPTSTLYYNNAQSDGDWGNLLNWWQDSGFSIQATALPTATNPVNLYSQVTQNTQGANQCFCASANFWSADFAYGLTLQSTGVVNMQGTSVMAGHTTDGVSIHDSSTLTDTSVIDADVTMRDSSRAYGYIGGNAYVYYDGGNGQFPIGGTVAGTVSYLGWPAKTPQWFNDQATGGADDGDFSNKANWWTDNTFTTRPINAEGTQELPDASTDVFIAPNTGIYANTGTSNPTVNSLTATSSYLSNITITVTNGAFFNGSGNYGTSNSTIYGNVTFDGTSYNDHTVIHGTATYKSASSLQQSWNYSSLGNTNNSDLYGSSGFAVNISGGGGSGGGFISRLLNLPWFIRF